MIGTFYNHPERKKQSAVESGGKRQQVLGRRSCGLQIGGRGGVGGPGGVTYSHDVVTHFGHFGEEEEYEHTGDDTERPGCGSTVFGEGSVSRRVIERTNVRLEIHAFPEKAASKRERETVRVCVRREKERAPLQSQCCLWPNPVVIWLQFNAEHPLPAQTPRLVSLFTQSFHVATVSFSGEKIGRGTDLGP